MTTRAARLAAAAAARSDSGPSSDSDDPPPPPVPPPAPPTAPPTQGLAGLAGRPGQASPPPTQTLRVIDLRVLRRQQGIRICVAADAQPAELRAAIAASLGSDVFHVRQQPGLVPCALSAGLLLHGSADLVVDAGLRARPSFLHQHALALAGLASFFINLATPPPSQVYHLLHLAAFATLAQKGPTLQHFLATGAALLAAYVSISLPPSIVPISLLQLAVPACGGFALTRLLPLLSACAAALSEAFRTRFILAGLVTVTVLRLAGLL